MKTVKSLVFLAAMLGVLTYCGQALADDPPGIDYATRVYAIGWHGLMYKVPEPEATLTTFPIDMTLEYKTQAGDTGAQAYLRLFFKYRSGEMVFLNYLPTTNYAVIRVSGTLALIRLLSDPDVVAVYPNEATKPSVIESFPLSGVQGVQWENYIEQGYAVPEGYGVSVAILDTPVKKFKDKLAGTPGPSTLPTAVSHSLIAEIPCGNNGQPVEYFPSGDATDNHGTATAGIVNAVAPAAKLVSLRLATANSGFYRNDDLIRCLTWVEANHVTYNIKVLNVSLGTANVVYTSQASCDRVPVSAISNRLVDAGVSVVVSSGNGGSTTGMEAPACASKVISVTAVADTNSAANEQQQWEYKDLLPFADATTKTTIAAPGCVLWTNETIEMRVGWRYTCGTSFSAPMVAGAMAVMQGAHGFNVTNHIAKNLLVVGATEQVHRPYTNSPPAVPLMDLEYSLEIGGLWLTEAPVNDVIGTYPSIAEQQAAAEADYDKCVANGTANCTVPCGGPNPACAY